MPDDRRRGRRSPYNSLVASAQLLQLSASRDLPKPESEVAEAWHYYESGNTPEVGFATRYLSNALSRCRLVAAAPGQGGDEPVPLESGPAVELIEALAGGTTGQSQLLAAAAPQMAVPGVGYFVGEPSGSPDLDRSEATFRVVSTEEITTVMVGQQRRYVIQEGDGRDDKRMLAPDAIAVRFWRPHHRFHWRSDSPIRSARGVLKELELLTQNVTSSATSRLAGRGVWVIPSEVSFPVPDPYIDEADPLMAMLRDVTAASIADPESPEAQTPIILRVPAEYVSAFEHFTFDTAFDERTAELRNEAIRRFATAVDLPAEVVLGLADSNHWTAWQIQESAQKLHIEPTLEALCHSITVGYLRPALKALGLDNDDSLVWYDTSELSIPPDRSGDAKDVFALGGIGFSALRRETGFDEGDAPTDEETERKLLLDVVAAAPSLFPIIAPMLGLKVDIPDEDPLPTSPGQDQPVDAPERPSDSDPTEGPPERPAGPPEASQEAVEAAATEAGLLAASDALVVRALEVAGRRLQNAARKARVDPQEGTRADLIHTRLPQAVVGPAVGTALAGAWDRVPDIAARYGVDPTALTITLDAYTQDLLQGGWPHEWNALAATLGATSHA